jgi:hypothetical protein
MFAGRYDEAVAELEGYLERGEPPPTNMAYAYSKAGYLEKALEVVKIREAAGIRGLADDVAIGDHEALLERLQSMYENRVESIVNIRCTPSYRDVVAVPGAREILQRLNLPTF